MKGVRFLTAVILTALLLAAPTLAISLDAGTGDDFYVLDTAYVLSSETQEQIVAYNIILEADCDEAQLVVVTVSYLDEDTELASLQLLNDWGVGSADESNGMLLLLVTEEHRGWLATGDGIDDVFTDSVAEQYLDRYFWDYIDADEFDAGVQSLAAALYDWFLDYYSVEDAGGVGQSEMLPEYGAPEYRDFDTQNNSGGSNMVAVIIVIVVVIWLLVASGRYRRMRGWGYTGGFWPVFWFGGRRYNDWLRQHGPAPRSAPGPRPGPGPNMGGRPGPGPNMGGRPGSGPNMGGRPSSAPGAGGSFSSRPGGGGGGRPSGGGFGGHGGGGGGGRH